MGLLVLGVVWAPSASAAPKLTVSATTNLSDGQTITVSGVGFAPNLKGIAVGQCKAGYSGPSDCNLAGGATFRNADAQGSIGTVTLKLATTVGGVDCTKGGCMIAAAPLPTSSTPAEVAANTAEVPLSFGAAEAPAAPATAAAQPAAQPATQPAAEALAAPVASGGDLPKTGAGDSLPVVALAGGALLTVGLGLRLLMPAGRREGAAA